MHSPRKRYENLFSFIRSTPCSSIVFCCPLECHKIYWTKACYRLGPIVGIYSLDVSKKWNGLQRGCMRKGSVAGLKIVFPVYWISSRENFYPMKLNPKFTVSIQLQSNETSQTNIFSAASEIRKQKNFPRKIRKKNEWKLLTTRDYSNLTLAAVLVHSVLFPSL